MEGNQLPIPVVPDTKRRNIHGTRLKGLTAWPHGDQDMKSHPGLAQNQPEVGYIGVSLVNPIHKIEIVWKWKW